MLTDADCRHATCPPDAKRHRLTDAEGLYLEVSPSGSKRWFWKFYPNGKESRLALGNYPEVTLKAARAQRDATRKARDEGTDPVQARRIQKATSNVSKETSFAAIAREFHQVKVESWSATYAEKWLRLVEKDLIPYIGALPLPDISAPVLLSALRRVEKRGAHESAHTLRQNAGQIFRFGVQTGRCLHNPASDLTGALKPVPVKHVSAVLEPEQAGELLRAIDGYKGHPVTRVAMALSALLFQRPGNIRAMEWKEVDKDAALWTIPSVKMKRTLHGKANGRPHLVPLATQAVHLLEELRPLTGHVQYVFPSLLTGDRCMSENTIRAALRRMGFSNEEMTAHGFRAMARTIMVEKLDVAPDVIEAQLAHGKSGPLGMAYDRAKYMDQRRQMMQLWADYLDQLRAGTTARAKRTKTSAKVK